MSVNRSKEAFKKVNNFLTIPCGFILLAMTLIVVSHVFARYVFGSPIEWGIEITTYMMLFIIFIGLAYTHQIDGHVRVDILLNALPKKAQGVLEIIGSALALIYVAIFIWKTGDLALEAYLEGLYSYTPTRVYLFPIYIWMPVGGLLFFLAILSKFHDHIHSLRE